MASAVEDLDPSIKQELLTVFMGGQLQSLLAHPELKVRMGGVMGMMVMVG